MSYRTRGLGRLSIAELHLGLSVPQAATVLAMTLVALPDRIEDALSALRDGHRPASIPPVPPDMPKTGNRVRRIAPMLKIISGCDRHQGDISTDPDNKAGRKLYLETRALVDHTPAPAGLAELRISPLAWLR